GASFDLGFDLSPGKHDFAAVAFDAKGRPGAQSILSVCVNSEIPDNGAACEPSAIPPAAVATLRWNTDADVDLSVLSPERVRYDRTNFAQVVDQSVVAELSADAASECQLDGRHLETFVWHTAPTKGLWYLYANLFDACGESA